MRGALACWRAVLRPLWRSGQPLTPEYAEGKGIRDRGEVFALRGGESGGGVLPALRDPAGSTIYVSELRRSDWPARQVL